MYLGCEALCSQEALSRCIHLMHLDQVRVPRYRGRPLGWCHKAMSKLSEAVAQNTRAIEHLVNHLGKVK